MTFGNKTETQEMQMRGVLRRGSLSNRLLSLILTVALATALCPLAAFAATPGAESVKSVPQSEQQAAAPDATASESGGGLAQTEQPQPAERPSAQTQEPNAQQESVQLQENAPVQQGDPGISDAERAGEVISKIDLIGEVTLESEAAGGKTAVENGKLNLFFEDCAAIGTYDGEPAYYFNASSLEEVDAVAFADLEDLMDGDGMIAAMESNSFVMGANEAPVSAGYAITAAQIAADPDWEFAGGYSLDSFGDKLYGYWIVDNDYSVYYVLISANPRTPATPEAPTFVAKVGADAIPSEKISFVENGYSYIGMVHDPANPEADDWGYVYPVLTCGLYTVEVPAGATAVDFEFSSACLAYGYDDDKFTCTEGMDEYDGGFAGKATATRSVDKDADGKMDYVQVQSPYDASWNTMIYYAITFTYENTAPETPVAPFFTAKVGDIAIDDNKVTYQENGYTYTSFEYAPDDPDADAGGWIYPQHCCGLYTVKVPTGTSAVDFEFSSACLAYGYDDDLYTCTEGENEYEGGFVGSITATRSVDKDGDGLMDFVQVQSPYDDSWNTTIYYAITFVYEDGASDTPEPGDTPSVMDQELSDVYAATGVMLASKANQLAVGSTGGEWAVLGLQRSSIASLSDSEIASYYEKVVDAAKSSNSGKIDSRTSTDNSRVVIALAALGLDPSDVEGVNLLVPLADMNYLEKQGVNGPIWALLAFDAVALDTIPTVAEGGSQATREGLIDYILNARTADDGWALSGNVADPDMTSMAITALAPYCDGNPDVKAAVETALERLSIMQQSDGGYASQASMGASNSGSCAQVIVALCSLGIDPATDTRFIKNGNSVLDTLLSFAVPGGGFKRIVESSAVDGMATEQALYALAAYDRFTNDKCSLFDMSDVKQREITVNDSLGSGAASGAAPENTLEDSSSNSGGQGTPTDTDPGSTEDTRKASGTTRSLGNDAAAADADKNSGTAESASDSTVNSERGKTISENATPLASLESDGITEAFPWPVIMLLGCAGTLLIGLGAGYSIATRKKQDGSQAVK